MEFNSVKNLAKKVLGVVGVKANSGVITKSSAWIKEESDKYVDMTKRKIDISVDTNAQNTNSYLNTSRAIECAIDEILKKGENTFKNILLIKNPYQYAPLCALALFTTKKACNVKVTVLGKTSDCDISYTIPGSTEHRVPIMGLYPDYKNKVKLELVDADGKVFRKKTFKICTNPLRGKSGGTKVTKKVSKTEFLYGLTLVYGGGEGYFPFAFDRNGDIRFSFSMTHKSYGFQPLTNGRVLLLSNRITRLTCTNTTSTQMFVVDQMGRFLKVYQTEKGIHHDMAELENGDIAVGSNAVDGNTFEDSIIEIDKDTGAVVNEIILKDYFDDKYVSTSDWAHLNSVEYNEEEKTVIASLRNLHSVVKINYEKKELVWIMGNPKFWEGSSVADKVLTPVVENIQWFFQQHSAYTIKADLDGNPDTKHIIVYDNHIHTRRPVEFYDKDKDSHVRIYTINEKEKTMSLFKSFPNRRSTLRSIGIFEKEAGRVIAMNGKQKNSADSWTSSVVEFDYETGEVLNEYECNYGFYRAYGFKFEPEEMAKPIDINTEYSFGDYYAVEECDSIDVSNAKTLPEPVLEPEYESEEERKEKLAAICRKDPDYYVDPEQDMARIGVTVEEDNLFVTLFDHQLEKIYLVGEKNTYVRDFSETEQERMEYFARAGNTDAIPLSGLKKDTYKIYYKHSVGLYDSKYYVKIS